MVRNPKNGKRVPFSAYFLLLTLCTVCLTPGFGHAAAWSGVDETVVEKFAAERGHLANKPLIKLDQGDLLPFAFLLAGTIGGFAAGYYWRMLLEGKPSMPTSGKKGAGKTAGGQG